VGKEDKGIKMKTRKIIITGGSGLVMSRIIELLGGKYNFISIERTPSPKASADKSQLIILDLTKKETVKKVVFDVQPEIIIHAAALTEVDLCEKDKTLAQKINVGITETLTQIAEQAKSFLVYISTDFVFNGKRGNYTEKDQPDPVNFYGQTKYEGETIVQTLRHYCILRTAFPYRADFPLKKDCLRWMLEKLERNEEIRAVSDQFVTPTFIDDMAAAIDKVIALKPVGVYHMAGSQRVSWFRAAEIMAQIFRFNPDLIKPIPYEEFAKGKDRALRPHDSSLSCVKLEKDFNIKMSSLEDGLKEIRQQREKML